jgi:HEAT repeat protein
MKSMLAAAVLAIALPCAAQLRLTNAKVTEQALAGSLEATVQKIADAAGSQAAWVAWAAPVADGRSSMCCFNGDWQGGRATGGRCHLEPGWSSTIMSRNRGQTPGNEGQTLRLEPPEAFFVFVRVENRRIERVRMFSEDCELEGGAAPVTWLTGVAPATSAAFLSGIADEPDTTERARKGALAALAQHRAPEAVTALVRLARRAPESELRGDALFWLSQRAGDQAEAAITEAIEHDPETQVKKKAVFALSQLPASEGVPKLIELARNHRNPAVRKQAMFWLGQSRDPRAIAFFEEVLK